MKPKTDFSILSYRWLKMNRIRLSRKQWAREIESHHNYPSLLALTDTLDSMNINHVSAHFIRDDLENIQTPYLAHLSNDKFIIVDDQVISSWNKEPDLRKDFISNWDGVCTLIDSGKAEEFKDAKGNPIVHRSLLLGFTFLLLSPSILFLTRFFRLADLWYSLAIIAGIVVSTAVILHELGEDNDFTNKLCGEEDSCGKVINSAGSKIFGVSLGDASFIFFSGLWLTQNILGVSGIRGNAIFFIPFLAIPVCGYSLYYQKFKVKAWCKLCLSIVSVVILLNGIAFFHLNQMNWDLSEVDIRELSIIIFCFILFFGVWLNIKNLIYQNSENEKSIVDGIKFKRDPYIFQSLLRREKRIDKTIWEDDISFGNKNASIQLLLLSNPLCRPCAEMHETISQLLGKYSDVICVTIRFLVTNAEDKNDKKNKIISSVIQNHLSWCQKNSDKQTSVQIPDYLGEWFKYKDINRMGHNFADESLFDIDFILKKHQQWIEARNLRSTPLLFVNGWQFPSNYRVNDLENLIMPLHYVVGFLDN